MSKILIVDDDKSDLSTMQTLLKKEGYEIKTATNGAKALDVIEQEGKMDLILLDIRMPTLSGYDLLRLLRERLNGSTKIIYVSIVPKQDVNMEDADAFIQKPFDTDEFVKKVKEVA